MKGEKAGKSTASFPATSVPEMAVTPTMTLTGRPRRLTLAVP